MFVCICNGITDSEINDAIADGARCLSQLKETLGVADCCGQCGADAKAILQQSMLSPEISAKAAKLSVAA